MAAPTLEQRRARAEPAVQVESRDRPARPLPVALGTARDQYDRPVEALDEPRRDDPDHAFVPVLSGDDVGAAAPLLRRPRLDLRDRLAHDATLDRLAVAVQLLERIGQPARVVRVVGEQQLERGTRMTETACSVDARPEAEADRAGIDRRRIDAGRTHQRAEADLLRACERAQPGD